MQKIIRIPLTSDLFCLHSEPALIEDDEDKEEPAPLSVPKPAAVPVAQSAIDLTAEFLHPLLTPENVANLVRNIFILLPFLLTQTASQLTSHPLCHSSGAHQHGLPA